MNFILGVLAGGLLFGKTNGDPFECTLAGRLNAWSSRKRFERMKAKAEKCGIEEEFSYIWQQHFTHIPFAYQNMEAYQAFQMAKMQRS